MSDISLEYSLNTPVFSNSNSNSNILNQKIIELIKNNNMIGGNGSDTNIDMSNYITLTIGIIIIIIGFVLLSFKNDVLEMDAIIINKFCDENNNECKINIKYTVDSTQYSKIVTINKSNILNIPNDSTIKIYYSKSDPNFIQIFNPNYYMIGIGSIIIGVFIIFFSIFDNSMSFDTTSKSSSSSFINDKTNLYSNSVDIDGLKIIYT